MKKIIYVVMCGLISFPVYAQTHLIHLDSSRLLPWDNIAQYKKNDTIISLVSYHNVRHINDTIVLLLPIDGLITDTILYKDTLRSFVSLSSPELSGDTIEVWVSISRQTYRKYKNTYISHSICSMGVEKIERKYFFFVQYPCYVGQQSEKIILKPKQNGDLYIRELILSLQSLPSFDTWIYYK